MNAIRFASKHLGEYKIKGNEIIPRYCPFCNGGEHHDKETFALNISKETYNCLRGSCGEHGHFSQLCKMYNEEYEGEKFEYASKRTYVKPQTVVKPSTSKVESYFKLRLISRKTMDVFKIGQDDKDNIIFPYYENEELVFVKYRPARKLKPNEQKAWREKDTKPILFGMGNCTPDSPLIITEGEFDCMSCYEAGLTNTVSVPSGCTDFTWLDTCWSWLKMFSEIIICADNDAAGRKMIKDLSKKLIDDHVLYAVEFPEGIKDANELLFAKGKQTLVDTVLRPKEIPIQGLIKLATLEELDVRNIPRTLSNIKQLDASMGGFLDGEVTVWTGQRGHGKSTVLSQLMVEVIEQGKRVCAYSGELSAQWFKYWTECQMAGPHNLESFLDPVDGKEKYFLKPNIKHRIRNWYLDSYYLYDNEVVTEDESLTILKMFSYAVRRYDCKVFMIDNLMTAKSGSHQDEDYYRAQSNFVGELIKFAKLNECHIHLVAHPRKVSKGPLKIDCDDVAGIGDITNKVHNVISWSRLTEEETEKETGSPDALMKILKNRSYGSTEKIMFKYDEASRRIYHRFDEPNKKYGWEI